MTDHLYHQPGDITVPDGFTMKDMNWTVVSWDMCHLSGPENMLAQFVLIPGMMLFRLSPMNSESWRTRTEWTPEDVDIFECDDLPGTLVETAVSETERLLENEGFRIMMEPYCFAIDQGKYYQDWPKHLREPPETLGDAALHAPYPVVRDIFNETFMHRKALKKIRWGV